MRLGAPCVMDSGQGLMHKWLADSLDTLQVVHYEPSFLELTAATCIFCML